jgi:acetyl esterase/lipase
MMQRQILGIILALSAYAFCSITVVKDISYLGEGREEKMDIYYPADMDKTHSLPAVVLIHGGGWMSGDKAAKRELNIAQNLVPEGYICASINYKLGAGAFPQNIYDCKTAIRFLRENAVKYGIDDDRIAVMGGSAGGHLALMVAFTADSLIFDPDEPYSGQSTKVNAVINLYGITDLFTRQYCDDDGTPNGELKDGGAVSVLAAAREQNPFLWKAFSPVNHITADSPPVITFHGKRDTIVDYLQAVQLHERLAQHKVINQLHLIDNAKHTFDMQSSGEDLKPIVTDFLKRFLKGKKTK